MGIREESEKYKQRLLAITVERQISTLAEAKDPKTLEWCLLKLQSGIDLQELRMMVGLKANKYVWDALRVALITADSPKDEGGALSEFYLRQERIIQSLERQIADIDEKILAGPKHKTVKGSGRQGDTIIEDRVWPTLLKLKVDLTKILADEANRSFHNFVDKKKLKDGAGKYAGARITIISNVPRPVKEQIAQVIEPDDE